MDFYLTVTQLARFFLTVTFFYVFQDAFSIFFIVTHFFFPFSHFFYILSFLFPLVNCFNYKNYGSKTYNAGIYLRLSKEDETTGQSESIGNQKDFLTRYAVENSFNIADYYIDDGYSGTNFSQLDGQFNSERTFAKTFHGLLTRLISKFFAFNLMFFINFALGNFSHPASL